MGGFVSSFPRCRISRLYRNAVGFTMGVLRVYVDNGGAAVEMTRDLARALVDDEALRALSRNRATFHQVWEAAVEQGVAAYFGWRIERTEAFGWATATVRRATETRQQSAAV